MGLLDFDINKILNNDAFMLGAAIQGNNSGHYGAFGPALQGGLNNYAQQRELMRQQQLAQEAYQREQTKWQQQQDDRTATMKATGGIPLELYKYQNPQTDKTTLEKQLIAAGFMPGTKAYREAMLLGISNGNYMQGNPSGLANNTQESPMQANDVTRHVGDRKEREKLKADLILDAQKRLSDEAKEAELMQKNISSMQRFKQLNQTNDTGGFTSLPGISWARTKVDPEYGTMESVSNEMIPQMRQGLPGAASDRDVAMFAKATISVDNKRETNDAIADAYIAAGQNKIDKLDFKQKWLETNGTLSGADAAWNKYLKEQPIFDHSQTEPVLNKSRMNWREYFGLESDGITSIKRIK